MKNSTLFILFVLISLTCNAQVVPAAAKEDPFTEQLNSVDIEYYKKLLDREFTKILTGQNTNFGTYATLSTKDEIASLAGNIKIKDESSLNINLKGGVTEGIIPLLNGEDVNANLSLNVQFNLGLYKDLRKNIIEADATSRLNYFSSLDSLRAVRDKAKAELALTKQKIELEVKQKKEKLTKLAAIDVSKIADPIRREIKRDSIKVQTDQLKIDITYLKTKVDQVIANEISRQSQNLDDKVRKFAKAGFEKQELLAYRIKWFSFFGKLNNKAFNTFDETAVYENQVNKVNFNQLEFGFAYNIYNLRDKSPLLDPKPSWINRRTYYFSIGAAYLLNDNFDDLTKKTLNEKQDISPSPNSRSLSETKTVYLGEYKRNLSQLKATANLYWFPTYNQTFAFHVEPSFKTNFEEKIKFDNIVGFLLGFKNSEKDKNVINVELYYNMKDIFKKSEGEDDEFSDRSSIGLKLNFPITFKSK